MRDQPTSPHFNGLQSAGQTAGASVASAPVMRATPADSLAASVNGPVTATPRATQPRQRPKRQSGRYTAVWAGAGVLAAAYVGVVLVGQEPIGAIANRWSAQDRDTAEMAAALARTQSEVAQLQRSVGSLEADMGRVKTQSVQAETREQAAAARIDAVETRVERISAQIAQVFAKAVPPQKGTLAQVAAAPRPTGAPIETGALPVKDAAPPLAQQRELAAARRAPAPAEASGTTPAAPAAAILLARGPSLDALRLSWSLLNERHKSSLGSLEPRVVTPEPGTHQLVAGPFASIADATKACATLKSRGVSCQPAEFKGEGL
jgi:SPOR domain